MSFALRPAVPADAAAIARVHVRMWQVAYRGLLAEADLDALTPEQREPGWHTILTRLDAAPVWVTETDGVVSGFVGAGPSRDDDASPTTGEVYAIYVDRERTGPGAGHALFVTALDWLAGHGYTDVTLWVLEGNSHAIGFYERHGWVHDGATQQDHVLGAAARELRYRTGLPPGVEGLQLPTAK